MNTKNTSAAADLAVIPPVLSALAALEQDDLPIGIRVHVSDVDQVMASEVAGERHSRFIKPTDVIVSRWYPGYRVQSLEGELAEEAVAILLAQAVTTGAHLELFRQMLAAPDITKAVVHELFARPDVPIKTRQYHLTDDIVRQTVRDVVLKIYPATANIASLVDAYAHVFLTVLRGPNLEVVKVMQESRFITTATSYSVDAATLRAVLMVDALRGVFSKERISAVNRELDTNATPNVLAKVLSTMFRQLSLVIPEIELRMEQVDVAFDVVRLYLLDPQRLSAAMRANSSVAQLAQIANIVLEAAKQATGPNAGALKGVSVQEQKEACEQLLRIIQRAPSIEYVPLESYAKHCGIAPVSGSDGLRRGAVVYMVRGQESRMEVLDVISPTPTQHTAYAFLQEYAPLTMLAKTFTQSLSSPNAMAGLANLIADETNRNATNANLPVTAPPILAQIGLSQTDVALFAMAHAEVLSLQVTRAPVAGVPHMLFGCTPAEEWRSRVFAGTTDTVFFTKPEDVLVYALEPRAYVPVPLPSRQQHVGASMMTEVNYVGDLSAYLSQDLQRPFSVTVPVNVGAEPQALNLQLGMISHLVGFDETKGMPKRANAFYASVNEPGVDPEYISMFTIALKYSTSANSMISNAAMSWLIQVIAPALSHPVVMKTAQRALNRALIAAKLDLRAAGPAHREVVIMALFATVLATLARFGKLRASQVGQIISTLPISSLSLNAQIALASLTDSFGTQGADA